jgi:hypothetical protein
MKLVSILCAALLLLTSMARATEPVPPHSWTVSNLRGPVLSSSSHLTLTVSKDGLTFVDKKQNPLIEIPANQVVNVASSTVEFSRAYQVGGDKTGASGIGMPMTGCGGSDVGCGGAALMYLMVLAIASPMHGRSHYVQITWNDRGVEQQLQFEASKDNYTAVAEALKAFGGTKYTDVEAQANKLQEEIAQNAGRAFALTLDRASKLGDYPLDPGTYKVLPLDRGEGKADVYLFTSEPASQIAPTMIKASMPANVCECTTGTSLDYLNGSTQIAAIQGGGKLFRFASE